MRILATVLILLAATVSAETPDVKNHWDSERIEDSSGLTTGIFLQQFSATTIRGEHANSEVTPRLQFRCMPIDATITANIDWQRFISSFSTEAGFKVDNGRFLWLKLKVDQTEQVTSSPSSDDTQKLIAWFMPGQKLLVEITPYSESPVTAEFNLTGFADAIDALTTQCQQART